MALRYNKTNNEYRRQNQTIKEEEEDWLDIDFNDKESNMHSLNTNELEAKHLLRKDSPDIFGSN